EQLGEHDEGEEGHHQPGYALREPVPKTVVRADDGALGAVVHCHDEVLPDQYTPNSLAPSTTVSSRLTVSTARAELLPNSLLTASWLTSIHRWRRPAQKWCR